MKKTKRKSKTLSKYRGLQAADIGISVGKYAMATIPAIVMTAINWDAWFANAGTSLPAGFSMLILSTVLAIVGISKRDEIIKKNVSGLFYLGLVFFCFALSFKFLSNICNQMGDMFLYTALGIFGGAVADQTDRMAIKPMKEEYKVLVESNALDPRTKKRNERRDLARMEAEAEAKMHQPTE